MKNVRQIPTRVLGPVMVIVFGLIASACLGMPNAANTHDLMDANPFVGANVPDPAWAPIYYGVAGVYGSDTNDLLAAAPLHIPSYIEYIPGVTNVPASSLYDALPGGAFTSALLPWNGATWAPTVRYVGGQYLMMYSEGVVNHGNCIGAATSPNGVTFTAVPGWWWCSPYGPQYGMLDPDLFIDPNNGNVWLIYSNQYPPVGFSEIDAQQLSSNGLGIVGGASRLFSLSDVSSIPGIPGGLGGTPEVENPAVTTDDYNYYDVVFSLGTWTSNSTYNIAEVGCGQPNGYCATSDGGVIKSGAGGASTLVDSSPASNWVIWASNTVYDGTTNALRTDYAGPTNEFKDGCCTSSAAPGAAANATTPTTLPPTLGYQPTTDPGYPVVAYTILNRDPIPGEITPMGITDPATAGNVPSHGPATIVYPASTATS